MKRFVARSTVSGAGAAKGEWGSSQRHSLTYWYYSRISRGVLSSHGCVYKANLTAFEASQRHGIESNHVRQARNIAPRVEAVVLRK